MSSPRDCESPQPGLIALDEARDRLLAAAAPVADTQTITLREAWARVLAIPQVSTIDVPPHDNSAMDGYAVRTADLGDGTATRLPVAQEIYAGGRGAPLASGTAARIFTGAPVPPGADAVVMQEHCAAAGAHVTITGAVAAGANIRRAAEDIRAGDTILTAGVRLRAQELGLAASVGLAELPVYRRPRVAIFFTGDELVEPGHPLGPGQIYDSNRYTLTGLLDTLGCEVVDLGLVEDTLEATRTMLRSAAGQADLVLATGGVSVGDKDHVRVALEQLGRLDLWRVKVKPGKPLAYGQVDATPFIGLPGNPVSAFATFCLIAAPFIKRLAGLTDVIPRPLPVAAAFDLPRAGDRRELLRARLVPDGSGGEAAEIFPHQGSHVLTSTTWADGLVDVPAGTVVKRGQTIDFLPFERLLR